MTGFQKKQIGLAVIAVLASTPASAGIGPVWLAGYTSPAAAQFVSMATNSVTIPVTKVFAQVTDGLKTVIVQSNADIATQTEIQRVEAIKKERAAQAMDEQQPALDACGDQTVAAYAQSVIDVSQAIKANLAARGRARSGGAPAAPEQSLQAYRIHANAYCDPKTEPGGECEKPAINDKVDLKSADVAADKSLFSNNLTHTKKQVDATSAFIANVVDTGDAPRKPTKSETDTAEGKKYEGLRQAYLARISMAQNALYDIANMRAPIPDSRNILNEIKESDSIFFGMGSLSGAKGYIANREEELLKISPSGDLSELELMDIEVGRRVDNPDWYEAVNTRLGPAALEKERTLMMALMLKMQYRMFRQGELQSALNAQQAVELAKNGMRDKLTQAEQAMVRGKAK